MVIIDGKASHWWNLVQISQAKNLSFFVNITPWWHNFFNSNFELVWIIRTATTWSLFILNASQSIVCCSLFSLSPHISASAENFPSSSPSSTATDVHASPTASLALPDCECAAASISLVALRNFSPAWGRKDVIVITSLPYVEWLLNSRSHVGTVYFCITRYTSGHFCTSTALQAATNQSRSTTFFRSEVTIVDITTLSGISCYQLVFD